MAVTDRCKRTFPLLLLLAQLCLCLPEEDDSGGGGGSTTPMSPETTAMLLGSTTFEITEMTVEEVPSSTTTDVTTSEGSTVQETDSTTAQVSEVSSMEVTEGRGTTSEPVAKGAASTGEMGSTADDGASETTTPMSTRRATLEVHLGDTDPPGLLLPFPLPLPNRTEPWVKNQADSRLVHQGVCDYCLFDGEGNFTSYGYPLDYPALLECTYRVKRVGAACSLQVRFLDFDLEESPGCRNDYLAVGQKKFCGRRRYRGHTEIVDFPKDRDEVTFYFHTNPVVSGKGFWIEVTRRPGFCDTRKNVIGPCEERHSQEEFQLWSPGYPEPYASNQKCWYYIRRATDAVCGLELTFLHFDLEQSDGCVYDYLDVDGQKLCGSITQGGVRVFMFNRDQLLMHFNSDSQNNKRGFHIKARQITTCYPGSVLPPPPLCDMCTDRLSDDITSYGFPTAYRGNMLCRVTITRPSNAFCAVEMHFREFDVEKSSRCDRDFLQIDRDRYCGTMLRGQHKRMTYDTDGNAVMVFKTDESVSGKGFHVRFHQVPCSAAHRDPVATAATTTTTAASGILPAGPSKEAFRCDRQFDRQREFYLQSPNYPSHYLDNQLCRYTITKAGDDFCHLELVFASFDVESSPGCQYDYLEFGGQRHCGSLPADHSYVIPFPGNEMALHFRSNVAGTRRGFSARARQIKCALGTSPPTSSSLSPSPSPLDGGGDAKSQGVVGSTTTTTPARTSTPYGFGSGGSSSSTTGGPYITRRSCDVYMEKMEFHLESANYPGDYEDGTDCVYTVRRAHGNICQMEITFLDFQLQPSDSCQGDYLAIDGTRVCGAVVPGTVRVMDFREAQKVMRFHTDDSQSDRGFHIAVRQNECGDRGGGSTPSSAGEQGDCDESFQKPEAMLVSVNYPSNYGNNLDCRYTVRKMSSSVCRLEMNFERFDVESSTDCEYDYLDVDGQRLCGIFSRNTTGMYDFEGNEKHLRFHSDAANSRPGFQIRLRQVECLPEDDDEEGPHSPQPPPFRPLQGGFTASVLDDGGPQQHEHKCDKILTNRLFDIRSPNYPGGYPPNLDCKYIVFQASRDICSVEFTFIDLDVDKDNECLSDFLEIDGERVCGSLPPDSKRLVHFSSSQMVFRFRSDQSGSRPGFHIKARQVECGTRLPPVTGLDKAPALGVPCMYEFCEQSGVFYSQGFPGPYPNQMSCTYRVIAAAPDRCRVELSFIQFNLHSNSRPDGQCGADFMEINGVRYCNRQLEGQIRILDFSGPRRSVTMHFISNDHDAGKGFLGFYKQLGCPVGDGRPPHMPGGGTPELYHPKPYPHSPPDVATKRQQHQYQQPSCDRLYALEEFEIESPGHPGAYRPGLDCRYFIRRHNDAVCGLLVTFDAFELEYSPGCHNDYLELGGHKICGQVPAGKTKQVPLRDFQTAFRFHSNEAVENRGFMLRVRQVACGAEGASDGGPSYDKSGAPCLHPHHPALGAASPPGGHPLGPAMFAPSGEPAFFPPSRGVPGGGAPPGLGAAPLGPPPIYPSPPSSSGPGRAQCDRAFNEPYFELRSADLGTGDLDCRFIVRRHGPDKCRLELLFVRFDVDCSQDQFRVQDVQICGRLDHYSTRNYDFEGSEMYLYYHTRSGGRASDFLIKGRQKGCTDAGSGVQPDGHFAVDLEHRPMGRGGEDSIVPRHHKSPPYPPPKPPTEYQDPRFLRQPPWHHPSPPASHPMGGGYPPSGHYPPPSHSAGGSWQPPPAHYAPPSHYPPPSPPRYAPPQQPPVVYPPSAAGHGGGLPESHGGYRPGHQPPRRGDGGHFGHHRPPGPPVDGPEHHPGMPWAQPPPAAGRPAEWTPRGAVPPPPPSTTHGGRPAGPPYPRPGPGQGAARPAADCDQTFTALEMTVQSPNFPGPYPARTICRYVVRRYDSATCALEVLFTRFDMEHNPDCQYEHLEVDGRKLCGTLPENSIQKFSFYQPETEKVLVFRSDQGSPRQGFSIRIRQVTDCAGATWMPGQDKVAPPPPNPLCDYCQREPRGQLSSPNYPQPYGPNARCTYRLEPVPGHCHVEMYFHHFDVESSPGCMKDYLEVDKTHRHCGNDLNKAIRKVPFPDGPSPEIRILFMTDGYGDGKGFHLEYRQLPCKSGLPSSPSGDSGPATPGSSGMVGNNGGGTAAASSDRKAHWVKGFREKTELVTASIFVENRRNASSNS